VNSVVRNGVATVCVEPDAVLGAVCHCVVDFGFAFLFLFCHLFSPLGAVISSIMENHKDFGK
jgi:hypothetical protein